MAGMSSALKNMAAASAPELPLTLYYAFKQSEIEKEGITSTGWATFLEAVLAADLEVDGTWPVRTELSNRVIGRGANALASSILLVCRRRPEHTETVTRRDFIAALRRELPEPVRGLQHGNIAPVDLAQAAIGPGMAVFSRYAAVLEADGSRMPVRSALIEINRVLDEVLAEQESEMDSDTRFCVAWFEQHGMGERAYGEAEVLLTAKNTSFAGLERAGVIVGGRGKVRLRRRDELDPAWDPRADRRLTDWECAQHLVRAMTAEAGGGAVEAARLVQAMGSARAEHAGALAYRLYSAAERKGWTEEALAYNILVTSWPQIQGEALKLQPAQAELAV